MNKNTNWSSPTRNWFKALRDLTSALQSGYNARIVREYNEDCEFPIRIKNPDENFRSYEFNNGYQSTYNDIANDVNLNDYEKHLTLNYHKCYGTQEAKDRYYNTGELSPDNFKGIGVSHLVKVSDIVSFLMQSGNIEDAQEVSNQYMNPNSRDKRHFFDFYRRIDGIYSIPKKFKHKLWVIETIGKPNFTKDVKEEIKYPLYVKIIIILQYPLRFIPKKSVLRMKEYKVITYAIGGVTNGYSIDIHIPKKFSF